MIIVADTSPINYLILIDQIELLPRLYETILLPAAVLMEMRNALAPRTVQAWAANPPSWIEVLTPSHPLKIANLDPGETEAIALAVERVADFLLIDDLAGRHEAVRRGLRVGGTLSVLDEADRAGFANLEASLARLRTTSFRLSQTLLQEMLAKRSARRS